MAGTNGYAGLQLPAGRMQPKTEAPESHGIPTGHDQYPGLPGAGSGGEAFKIKTNAFVLLRLIHSGNDCHIAIEH